MREYVKNRKIIKNVKNKIDDDFSIVFYRFTNVPRKSKFSVISKDIISKIIILDRNKEILNVNLDSTEFETELNNRNIKIYLYFYIPNLLHRTYTLKIKNKKYNGRIIGNYEENNYDFETLESEPSEPKITQNKSINIQDESLLINCIEENTKKIISEIQSIKQTKNVVINSLKKIDNFENYFYSDKFTACGLFLTYQVEAEDFIQNIKFKSSDIILLYIITENDNEIVLERSEGTYLDINLFKNIKNFEISFLIKNPNFNKMINTELIIDKFVKNENFNFKCSEIFIGEINYIKEEENFIVYFSLAKRNTPIIENVSILIETNNDADIESLFFTNSEGLTQEIEAENCFCEFKINEIKDEYLSSENNFIKISIKNLKHIIVEAKTDNTNNYKFLNV